MSLDSPWIAVLFVLGAIVVFAAMIGCVALLGYLTQRSFGCLGAHMNRRVFRRIRRGRATTLHVTFARFCWFLSGGSFGLWAGGFMGFWIGGYLSPNYDDPLPCAFLGIILGAIGTGFWMGLRYAIVGGPPRVELDDERWRKVRPLNPQRQVRG